jgi:hypothetical protein
MKVITIGRNPNNDIIVDDTKVSRTHLQIIQDDNGKFSVVDFNSTNGTFVNEQQIKGEVPLMPNDILRIGNHTLPWESYFLPSPTPTPISDPYQSSVPRSKNYIWITAAVVALLVIGGGITLKVVYDKKQIIIEAKTKAAEEEKIAEIQRYTREAEEIASGAQIRAEQAMRTAAQTKSKKDLELAIAKQKEADKAKAVAQQARAAEERMEIEKNEALAKAKQESVERVKAEEAKKAVEEEKANILTAKEKLEKDFATEQNKTKQAEIKANFYSDFSKLSQGGIKPNDYYTKVCKELKYTSPNENGIEEPIIGDNSKKVIEEKFNEAIAKNDEKQIKIITEAVNKVLLQKQGDVNTAKSTFEKNVPNLDDNGLSDVYKRAFNEDNPPIKSKDDLKSRFNSEKDSGRKIEIAKIVANAVEIQQQLQAPTQTKTPNDNQ